jgi:endonuclease/exonuclease/phosphatase family metal-dependent hydrolase
MSRNLYLGADIFKVIEAAQNAPSTVPWVVAEVFQTVQYTNFPARAEAIADEIALAKPQVIGLQEVVTFFKQTPGDFFIGNPNPAEDEVYNFYDILDAALRARGMYYEAFIVTNADVELPMFDPIPSDPSNFSDVRMVDHDVVLVRRGHPASLVLSGNYIAKVGMDLAGVTVEFTRGFIIVDAEINGEIFRFVNTHLEVSSLPGSIFRVIQYYQMAEILVTIDSLAVYPGARPIIMVGDFNSSPEHLPGVYDNTIPYYPPYMLAIGAGYLDTWLLQSKYEEGYTSGFDELVSDPESELFERIDFVFLDPLDLTIDEVKCYLVGDDVSDMVPNPDDPDFYLWPSDHAGVAAKVDLLTP